MKYRLKEICIEVTNECPNNCLHCSSEAGYALPNELTFDEIIKIVDVFTEMNSPAVDSDKTLSQEELIMLMVKTSSLIDEEKENILMDKKSFSRELQKLRQHSTEKPVIELSGGEPLVKKRIIDIIQYIKKKNLKLIIYTSGLIKTKRGSQGIAENPALIKELGDLLKVEDGDCVVLSMEGPNEKIHDYIVNREGHFNIVEEAIIAFKEHKINVEVHSTPMKPNYRKIPALIKKVNKLKIQNISFLRLVPQGRALNYYDKLMLNKKEFKELIAILHREWLDAENSDSGEKTKIRLGCPIDFRHLMYPVRRKPCHGGRDQLLIRPDGDIHPCPAWKEIRELRIGQTRDENKSNPIRDAWLNSEIINLFRQYSAKELWGDCFYCIHGTDICAGGCPAQRIIANKKRGIRNKEAQLRVGPDPLCFRELL